MATATTGRLGRMGIIKETNWGVYIDPTRQVSLTKEDLKKKIEFETDGRLIAKMAPVDFIKVGEVVEGSIDVTSHPEEIGPLLNFGLMKNTVTATAPQAYLFIVYVGTNAYADVDIVGTTLTCSSGATVGTKVGQVTLDKAAGAYDTVKELADAITAASADWKGYYHGLSTATCAGIAAFAAVEITGHMLFLPALPATAKKVHYIRPAGAADSEISFSACIDRVIGTGKCLSVAGTKVNSMTLTIEARKIINLSMGLVGKIEATGATYPAITSPDDIPYIAGNAVAYINGIRCDVVKSLSIAIANNMDISGMVGSLYIQEPIRQGVTATVNGQVNLIATEWERYYPLFGAGTSVELVVYIENAGYADATLNVKKSILIRIPALKLKTYDSTLTGPNRLTSDFTGENHECGSYDSIAMYVVDTDVNAY